MHTEILIRDSIAHALDMRHETPTADKSRKLERAVLLGLAVADTKLLPDTLEAIIADTRRKLDDEHAAYARENGELLKPSGPHWPEPSEPASTKHRRRRSKQAEPTLLETALTNMPPADMAPVNSATTFMEEPHE